MAPQDASNLLNSLQPALQAAAKNVLRHAYGPDGLPWGTRFTDLEELAVQVGHLLSREILGTALQQQAESDRPPDLQACPTCAGVLEPQLPEERTVLARPGPIAWPEPAAFCPRCRRAFFPSVPQSGT